MIRFALHKRVFESWSRLIAVIIGMLMGSGVLFAPVAYAASSHIDTPDYCLKSESLTLTAQEVADEYKNGSLSSVILSSGSFAAKYRTLGVDYDEWSNYQGRVQIDLGNLVNADLTQTGTYTTTVYIDKKMTAGLNYITIPVTVIDPLPAEESHKEQERPVEQESPEEQPQENDVNPAQNEVIETLELSQLEENLQEAEQESTDSIDPVQAAILAAAAAVGVFNIVYLIPLVAGDIYLLLWFRKRMRGESR